MLIENVPFCVTDWGKVEAVEHKGKTGSAFWKTIEFGDIRVRSVEFSRDFAADDWCQRGHVLYVIEGEIVMELADGRTFVMTSGMSYTVASGAEAHRSHTTKGAKLFIVD